MKSAKGQLDLISEFSKVPGYTRSIYINHLHFCVLATTIINGKNDIYKCIKNCEILRDISNQVVQDCAWKKTTESFTERH